MYNFHRYRGYFWMLNGSRVAFPSISITLIIAGIVDDPQSGPIAIAVMPLLFGSFIGMVSMAAGLLELGQQIPQLRYDAGRTTPATMQLMAQLRSDIFRLNRWKPPKT